MTQARRLLFVATILTGSFLLFMVQPLVARMALPRLGGAPAVWNSAMLVYQALLLGGYAYAHALSRMAVRRQAMIHLALLALAGLTLPIALADLPPPAAGWEALWVPALLAITVGPVFFLVSAQAPLMQRWFAADEQAGDPYWLYAASNLGSFAGLISYPLLFEPNLSLVGQSRIWTAGYVLLFALVALAGASRWRSDGAIVHAPQSPLAVGWRRIFLWLALAAVPSGLMLSTTTHLTTDIVAMPLLWVVPLGLYLLSYVFAFNERSATGMVFARTAPSVLILAGGMAMVSRSSGSMTVAFAMVIMLFVVAVALHRRLYALRPEPARLTFFYLVISLGGVLGGAFSALVAPVVFDWVWEHPLLVLAAAALLPNRPLIPWLERHVPARQHRAARIVLVLLAIALSALLTRALAGGNDLAVQLAYLAIALIGVLVLGARWALLTVLLVLMLARGGYETLKVTGQGLRDRSYFGVYTVSENEEEGTRVLLHGTTVHGRQNLDPDRAREPTTYYGRTSGVGLALQAAPALFGQDARIGIVGLGAGTLACYRQPGQSWRFFEIDPAVLDYSQNGTFTFLRECAPEAQVHIGDARLVLEGMPDDGFDLLAIDAFSSDAIPLHLLTREAFHTYDRVLAENGLLVMHISNRFIDLRPVLSAHARERGWLALLRDDPADSANRTSSSIWVVFARKEAPLIAMMRHEPSVGWYQLTQSAETTWTDDHASVLPHLMWDNIFGGK